MDTGNERNAVRVCPILLVRPRVVESRKNGGSEQSSGPLNALPSDVQLPRLLRNIHDYRDQLARYVVAWKANSQATHAT